MFNREDNWSITTIKEQSISWPQPYSKINTSVIFPRMMACCKRKRVVTSSCIDKPQQEQRLTEKKNKFYWGQLWTEQLHIPRKWGVNKTAACNTTPQSCCLMDLAIYRRYWSWFVRKAVGDITPLHQGLRNGARCVRHHVHHVPAEPCATLPQIWEQESLCAD